LSSALSSFEDTMTEVVAVAWENRKHEIHQPAGPCDGAPRSA
jgi:hypothetical protein